MTIWLRTPLFAPAEESLDSSGGGVDDIDDDTNVDPDPDDSGDDDDTDPPLAATPPRKEVSIPTSAIGQIRKDERARGRKIARAEAEKLARSLGFESHAAMVEAAKTAPKPKPRRVDAGDSGEVAALRAENDRLKNELAQIKQTERKQRIAVKVEKRRSAKLESQLEVKEAEHDMTVIAMRSGVKDVDYALQLARRHCAKLTEEERATFDEAAFFGSELKKTHAYIYEAEDVPAGTPTADLPTAKPADKTVPNATTPPQTAPQKATTSGPSAGNPPAPHVPGAPIVSDPHTTDMRTVSRAEYEAKLQALGLQVPGGSLPI